MSWQTRGTPQANGNSSGNSFSVNAPSGLQDGDLIVINTINIPITSTPGTPSGFTQVLTYTNASVDARATMFAKRANSEPGSYNISATGAAVIGGNTSAFFPLSITQLVAANGSGNTGTSNTPQATAISPPVSGTLLLFSQFNFDTFTANAPSGMTEILDDPWGYLAWQQLNAAGSTGNKSQTLTGSSAWLAVLASFYTTGYGILTNTKRNRLII